MQTLKAILTCDFMVMVYVSIAVSLGAVAVIETWRRMWARRALNEQLAGLEKCIKEVDAAGVEVCEAVDAAMALRRVGDKLRFETQQKVWNEYWWGLTDKQKQEYIKANADRLK